MRLSGFTRLGAMIGFFGALAMMAISSFQFDSNEVSRKDVLLAELLFGVPIFTIVGAALGAGWDFFEKRDSKGINNRSHGLDSSERVVSDQVTEREDSTNSSRRRRRKPTGSRRNR